MATELTGYLEALDVQIRRKNTFEVEKRIADDPDRIFSLGERIKKVDKDIAELRQKIKNCISESKTTEIVEAATEYAKLPETAKEEEKKNLLSKIVKAIKEYSLPIAGALQLTKVLLEVSGIDVPVVSKIIPPLEKMLGE
jgi:predicted flavoprotein YhiN